MLLSYRTLSALAFLLILPFCTQAQSLPKISADFNQTRLVDAFAYLATNYPISFSYEDDMIENVVVSVKTRRLPLDRAMGKILDGTGLDFEIVDNQYVLIKKGNAPLTETTPTLPQQLLCGKVLDGEINEPLIGATVYIKGTSHGTYTDTVGYFELVGHFTKKDTIVISYLGYSAMNVLVEGFLQKPCATVKLSFANTWMSDILVKDFSVDMLTLSTEGNFHFKKEKIPTLPGWGEPDVLRMLQLLPGIGSAEESAARLNVRGSTPDQNLVLWEGIPMYHTGHFFGLYDAFNPFIVDEVDVWRGNFGAEHGGRNASVIDIKGRPDIVDESTWGLGFNFLHTNIFMEKPLFRKTKYKRGAIIVAGRFSNASNKSKVFRELFNQVFQNGRVAIQDSLRQNNGSTTWSPRINYGDFNVKMRWQGKKKNDNSISIYTGADQLDYNFAYDDSLAFSSTNDYIRAHNFGMSWQHEADWKPNLKANFKVAASSYDNQYTFQWNNIRDSAFIYRYNTSNLMQDVSAQLKVNWQVDEHKKWAFGYHFSAQQSSLVYQDTQVLKMERNIFSQDTSVLGLHTFYSAFEHKLNPKFSYSVGFRLNLSTRRQYFTEPRASFRWQPLGNNLSVKGSMAHNWQFVFQIVDFTDLGAGEPLWALAKDSISAQELWQWTLGASYETNSLLVDAEFYYKDSRNLTSRNLLVDRGFERPLSFDGSSVAYGFDLLFRKRIPPYSVWFAYSYGQVEQKFPELNSGLPYPARHDIRHQINFVNMLDLGKFDLSVNLHFRTGTPYSIPNVEQVPCPNCTVDNFTHELSFEKLNTERLPNTLRLDASATYAFGKKNRKWKIGLSFFNLLNRTNIIDKDFVLDTPDPDEPQAGYKLQELNRLAAGRAPNFFLQYEW